MNVKKIYPKLFKSISRVFGARAAIKMIKSIAPEVYDIKTLQDDYRLSRSFLFSKTPQGLYYWWEVANKLGQYPIHISDTN